MPWPNPRFTVSGDCVTDNLTGSMWTKDANQPNGSMTWQEALEYVASINNGAGLCGHHDWRLPNRKDLQSLIDHSQHNPALSLNHPFTNVQSSYYWSSTSHAAGPIYAWIANMRYGYVDGSNKGSENHYVWPVRLGIRNSIYLPLIMR